MMMMTATMSTTCPMTELNTLKQAYAMTVTAQEKVRLKAQSAPHAKEKVSRNETHHTEWYILSCNNNTPHILFKSNTPGWYMLSHTNHRNRRY